MRGKLLYLIFALIFSATALILGQTAGVRATGAPTDNITTPEIPTADEAGVELVPTVPHALLGPSSQPEDAPPSFIPEFVGPSKEDKFKVTGDENWYLDVDINMPGWLYIYEYFLAGDDLQGKWIAYKWQLLESGIWRLGPFTAANDAPEGQHVYRLWFYGDGQWAAEDPDDPKSSLVSWTYSRGQPTVQTPPPAIPEATSGDETYASITQPIVLVLGSLALVAIVILGLYIYWKHGRRSQGQDIEKIDQADTQEPATALPSDVAGAKIALPNGAEISLAGSKVIGRGELARALGLDELGLISRRHFEIKYEDERFYIEDLGSANGTRLNGDDISGKGPVSLNDDDIIEPAGVIKLEFLL